MVTRLMNDNLLRENERDSSAGLINAIPRARCKKIGGDDLSLSFSLVLFLFFLRSNATRIFYVIIIYVDRSGKS